MPHGAGCDWPTRPTVLLVLRPNSCHSRDGQCPGPTNRKNARSNFNPAPHGGNTGSKKVLEFGTGPKTCPADSHAAVTDIGLGIRIPVAFIPTQRQCDDLQQNLSTDKTELQVTERLLGHRRTSSASSTDSPQKTAGCTRTARCTIHCKLEANSGCSPPQACHSTESVSSQLFCFIKHCLKWLLDHHRVAKLRLLDAPRLRLMNSPRGKSHVACGSTTCKPTDRRGSVQRQPMQQHRMQLHCKCKGHTPCSSPSTASVM